MRFLTSSGCSSTSNPATVTVPEVGGRKQVSTRMVVVLPAPFGPRKPTIWPFCTSKEMWSTAVFRAYLLVRPLTVIIRINWKNQDLTITNRSTVPGNPFPTLIHSDFRNSSVPVSIVQPEQEGPHQ